MRLGWMTILLLAGLGGCSWLSGSRQFSVYFVPYSAVLNQQARETIVAAAQFARSHPMQPIAVDGFSAPPDANRDVEGLSAQRAEVVKLALVSAGVGADRITTVANGIVNPKPLPQVAVRRVDISIGK